MAHLRYLDDEGLLQMKTLDSEQFLIGRAASCQVSIEDDMISREHARIDMETDGRFRIRDLGSRNKTYVNGEVITESLLTPGDIVRIGERVLEYLDDQVSAERVDLEFLTPDRTEPPNSEWIKIKAPLSLTIPQLEQLSRLGSDRALTIRPEDIADAALGRIVLDVQAERGFIALRGEKKTDLHPLAHRALKRPNTGSMTPVSQSFAYAPLLQSVGGRYPKTASQLNPKQGYAVTAIVAPLMFRGQVVGLLYVDRPTSKKPFNTAALQYVIAAGVQTGSSLGEASRRLTQSAAREGVAWMATLRRLQTALTVEPTQGDGFDVAVKRFGGRARCGDFADLVHLDEQRIYAVVVDGGGHGVTGIVQANTIRTAVRAALTVSEDTLLDPSVLFNELNSMVASAGTRQVLPCTYVGIDMSAGKLAYINAGGMPPLLLVAPGRLVTLDQPALILGVDRDYSYEATRVDLPDAFRLVCHTDGLKEATSAAGEALGDQRLHEVLLDRKAFAPADILVKKVEQAWTAQLAGGQSDDDALVLAIARG